MSGKSQVLVGLSSTPPDGNYLNAKADVCCAVESMTHLSPARQMRRLIATAIVLFGVFLTQHAAMAELVIMPIRPIQDLILIPGTPFNDGAEEVLLEAVGVEGIMFFDSLDQVGTSIDLVNGRFFGTGTDARLGGALSLTTGTGIFTQMFGVLEDVVRDPNHPGFASGALASIISANMSFIVPDYGVRLEGLGIDLEVRDPFLFRAQLNGIPSSNGTRYEADPFSGDASRLAVYLAGTDTIIGYSTNRRLIAVPEPTAMGLLGLAIGGAGFRLRRRR